MDFGPVPASLSERLGSAARIADEYRFFSLALAYLAVYWFARGADYHAAQRIRLTAGRNLAQRASS